ncbi:MAG: hypothetical protein V6Z82_05510 [Flavobacteriales bacterium]
MKKRDIVWGVALSSAFAFSACQTQKKIANAVPHKAIASHLPCFSAQYQSGENFLFGIGMGESLDSTNAHRKASLETKGKISSQIHYLLNKIVDEYRKKAHLSGEQIADLRVAAAQVANMELTRVRTACQRDNVIQETGKTTSYITNQIATDQVIDAFVALSEKGTVMHGNSDEIRAAAARVLEKAFKKG